MSFFCWIVLWHSAVGTPLRRDVGEAQENVRSAQRTWTQAPPWLLCRDVGDASTLLIVAGVALVRDRLAPLVTEPHSNVAFTCARSFTPAPNTWVAQAASGMTSVVLALAVWRRSACSLEPLPSPREWRPHLAALVLHCSIEEVSSSTSTALCLQRQGLVARSLNRRLLRDCGLYS